MGSGKGQSKRTSKYVKVADRRSMEILDHQREHWGVDGFVSVIPEWDPSIVENYLIITPESRFQWLIILDAVFEDKSTPNVASPESAAKVYLGEDKDNLTNEEMDFILTEALKDYLDKGALRYMGMEHPERKENINQLIDLINSDLIKIKTRPDRYNGKLIQAELYYNDQSISTASIVGSIAKNTSDQPEYKEESRLQEEYDKFFDNMYDHFPRMLLSNLINNAIVRYDKTVAPG